MAGILVRGFCTEYGRGAKPGIFSYLKSAACRALVVFHEAGRRVAMVALEVLGCYVSKYVGEVVAGDMAKGPTEAGCEVASEGFEESLEAIRNSSQSIAVVPQVSVPPNDERVSCGAFLTHKKDQNEVFGETEKKPVLWK